jgi:hypothetical protein
MAQVDVKDRVVCETEGTIQGYIFLVFMFKTKIHHYYYYYYYNKKKKTEVVKETPTFERTKNSEQFNVHGSVHVIIL